MVEVWLGLNRKKNYLVWENVMVWVKGVLLLFQFCTSIKFGNSKETDQKRKGQNHRLNWDIVTLCTVYGSTHVDKESVASDEHLITHKYSVRKNDDGSRYVLYPWLAVATNVFFSDVPKMICLISWMLVLEVRVSGCFGRSGSRRWTGWGEERVEGLYRTKPQCSHLHNFTATLTDHFHTKQNANIYIYISAICLEAVFAFSYSLTSSNKTNKQSNNSSQNSCRVYNCNT